MDYSELINKPLKANKKNVGKDGKTYWNQCGLTVWLGDYNGQPTVSLVDERTGERYPCFPPRPQADAPAAVVQTPDNSDDVPF